MTTKPKAKKFRIRRTPATQAGPVSDTARTPSEGAQAHERAHYEPPVTPRTDAPDTSDYHEAVETPSRAGMVSSASEMSASQDIDAIRSEGLTGRQLRMARRMAQKHGLAPTSDFDAVRLLRAKGIDDQSRPLTYSGPSEDGGVEVTRSGGGKPAGGNSRRERREAARQQGRHAKGSRRR